MNILSAYVVTCGIITYRWWTRAKQLPPPLAYAGATAVFGGIGIMAKSAEAEKFAGVLAWAVVVGALAAPASNVQAVHGIFGTPPATATVPTGAYGHTANQAGPAGTKVGQITNNRF